MEKNAPNEPAEPEIPQMEKEKTYYTQTEKMLRLIEKNPAIVKMCVELGLKLEL